MVETKVKDISEDELIKKDTPVEEEKTTPKEESTKKEEPIKKEESTKKEEPIKKEEPQISPFLQTNDIQNIEEIDKSELKKEQAKYEKKTIKDNVLFRENCKLYRMNQQTKAFELRGEGEILIVEDHESSQYKISMIRDQIKTFGCNHFIDPRSDCLQVKSYKNAWLWYSLGDVCNTGRNDSAQQIFLVRFKGEKESKSFKELYEKGREVNKTFIRDEKD